VIKRPIYTPIRKFAVEKYLKSLDTLFLFGRLKAPSKKRREKGGGQQRMWKNRNPTLLLLRNLSH